jgi:hypothetical protein
MSNYTETYYQSILAQASYGIFPQFVKRKKVSDLNGTYLSF